jgi:hypothetical protein
MANVPADDEEFIGSHMKAKNGYGQNGYQGASSDLPGEHTTSDFLPQAEVPTDDWQTRKVSAEGYSPAHGMKAPAGGRPFASQREPVKVLDENVRRPRIQAAPGSFQR